MPEGHIMISTCVNTITILYICVVTDMGNLQTVLPSKEAKKVINAVKEKEVSFNQEVCQEAL